MRLFDTEKVKKFFDILGRLDRGISTGGSPYKGRSEKNPDMDYCQKQVFVERTIGKWLKSKYLILYKENQFGVEYKQFVFISYIDYYLGHGEDIDVKLFDYTNPNLLFDTMKIHQGNAIYLEGEWCDDDTQHKKLWEMVQITHPDREYVFKSYDMFRLGEKGVKDREDIESTVVIKAKTENEARKKAKKFERDHDINIMVSHEIIEIRDELK